MKRSCKLTIFEGCDGSGKTTAAKKFAEETGALYIHFPALREVDYMLPRLYVEAMLPALMGYQDVVFDRSWLSEPIYGEVHREGKDRIGPFKAAMLERLAMRCGALVIFCDPGWSSVHGSYERRAEQEMLRSPAALAEVYRLYKKLSTSLPFTTYDYTADTGLFLVHTELNALRMVEHKLEFNSAGNLEAPIVLVGDELAERKDTDPWYQWPFASFSTQGCSLWLTQQLKLNGITEDKLLWLNRKDAWILEEISSDAVVVALGEKAKKDLYGMKIKAASFEHPQAWKRFHARERYPLIQHLETLLSVKEHI